MRAEVTNGAGPGSSRTRRTARRFRHLAICIALTALAFQQDPGQIVPDTKVDLNVNPAGWLLRSLHLWDPTGTFGQLQNQAYGYLWPMGPFFLLGSELGLAPWVVQRLWWALLFCVAYLGAARLAGRLGIGTPAGRMIAGVAFALSPRILTQLGWSSVEAWPSAIAPWVLIPLVGLARGAPLRRAVAGSAVAVACAGGVNATAVLAVVPLALLWLATLQPVRRRVAALAAWCGAVALATAWWLVPLLVLGRYSPPFLDYIETARNTTSVTDAVTTLRGASYWVAYLASPSGPTIPAGARLANEPLLVVATLAVAGLGVLGLSRRGMPHRRFLVTGLVLGAALVGLGHVGDLPNILAGPQQRVPRRCRRPAAQRAQVRRPAAPAAGARPGAPGRPGRPRGAHRARAAPPRDTVARAWLTAGVAMAAVAAVASPAVAGGLATPGSVREVPGYWHEAADWLDTQHRPGTRPRRSRGPLPVVRLGQHHRRDHPAAAGEPVGGAQRHPLHPARHDPAAGRDRGDARHRRRLDRPGRPARPLRDQPRPVPRRPRPRPLRHGPPGGGPPGVGALTRADPRRRLRSRYAADRRRPASSATRGSTCPDARWRSTGSTGASSRWSPTTGTT